MNTLNRRSLLLLSALAAILPLSAKAAPTRVTLYKNPNCTCCEAYAEYLNKNDFLVDIVLAEDLIAMGRQAGIPAQFNGCHITKADGYAVIGHVPVNAVRKLLTERPKIIGISIPGMPVGLPGMEGPRSQPVAIYEIASAAAAPKVYMMVP